MLTDETGAFKSDGGFTKLNKIFDNQLEKIILELNGYIYEDGSKTA
jgi:type I restriction enzyme R subunit